MSSIYTLLVGCAYSSIRHMHAEDRSVVGRYEVEVFDDQAREADIVEAVLDAFHYNFGVEEVDGIECQVIVPDGRWLHQEEDGNGGNVRTEDAYWVGDLTRTEKKKLRRGPG